MTNPRSLIVKAAKLWLGKREETKNRFAGVKELWAATSYPDGWANREPYCAAFVAWCVWKAAQDLPKTFGGKRCRSASVAGWREWAKEPANGVMILPDFGILPAPGDIVSFLPAFSHIGIVEDYDVHGKVVHTIEGNTDGSGSREGDGIYRRERALKSCGEFYRVPLKPA